MRTPSFIKQALRPAAGLLLLAALLAALAAGVSSARAGSKNVAAIVPDGLLQAAKQNANGVFDVLVTGDGTEKSYKVADKVARMLGKGEDRSALAGSLIAQFATVSAVEVKLQGKDVVKLAKQPGLLSVVPNSSVTRQGYDNGQHWDESSYVHWFWGSTFAKVPAATIAIVDSGVSNANNAFGNRLVGQFDLGGGSPTGDPRGHGTFVAQLAAGAAAGFAGAAPTAPVISLDVFDATGRANTSDVIRACDWILQHKAQYNIRVVNLSLQTSQETSFLYDPLDQAVERLWQAGVVVVTAAGNYASNGQPSGVLYAPGNDPFVLTVGAADIKANNDPKDDVNAPWSAYGYTPDGFAKPEVAAPGRYLIEQIPLASTLFADFPNNIVKPGQLQLSGTSFAAPIVSGMAADLLGTHPDWTPDQIKGVLMVSTTPLTKAAVNSMGVGEVNAQKAFSIKTPPNPNAGLDRFLVADPAGGPLPVFDSESWLAAAQANASWNSASWNSASWASASWASASWASASWASASWASASWASASWASASWNSVANNAAADGKNLNY